MIKQPLEYVAREVNKLYNQLDEKHSKDPSESIINEHLEFVNDFIVACGWEPDELLEKMFDSTISDELDSEEVISKLDSQEDISKLN